MSTTRVRWRERQRVTAADLTAEQEHRLRVLGRHHLAPHGWGVVRGLWLRPLDPRVRMRWHITEGVAIDGYGRELLVTQPIHITLPAQGVYRIFLYYCEAPVGLLPCDPCREDRAPRVGQFVQAVADLQLEPLAEDSAELSVGRAAGRLPGKPAWPVFLGIVSTVLSAKPDYRTTRYHHQRAALLRSPGGGALLRLGPLGPDDPYRMLLSAASGTNRPIPRIAIDRDGGIHLWRLLAVTGPDAAALVQVTPKAVLSLQGVMPTGIQRRLRVVGQLNDPLNPRLTVRWADNLGLRLEESLVLGATPGGSVFLDARVPFVGGNRIDMRLLSATPSARRLSIVERPRTGAPQLIAKELTAVVGPRGGRLELTTFDADPPPAEEAPCNPSPAKADPAVSAAPPGAVLEMRPAAAYEPGAAAREMYAQSTAAPDESPGTELRINGGTFDEGDPTSRVGFGVRDGDGNYAGTATWHGLLTMNGGGNVTMPAEGTHLHVSHTLQLPPITADPGDPLTQALLALAYNAGLRQAGKIATGTTVTTTTMPADVVCGQPLKYKVTVSGTTKRLLEIIVGTEGAGDVSLRILPLPPDGKDPKDHEIELPEFQHRASKVKLVVEALVSESQKDYAVASTGDLINVKTP